jgi:hypothetical protein
MAIRQLNARGLLDRSIGADLFRHTLARIPSLFGRLQYFASLRDPNTGAYRHYGLSSAFGREQSAQALRLSHTRTFREWLQAPLRQRQEDLQAYLASLNDPKGLVVGYWLESQSYLAAVPDSASRAEREHFTKHVERLLRNVKAGGGAEAKDPKSEPRT